MLISDSSFSAKARSSASVSFWWPASVPQVAKPRATGTGVSRRASRNGLRPEISVPFEPPPPYWTALPFHWAGRLTSKLIGGAVRSTGAIAPSTLQYSRVPLIGAAGSDGTVCTCAEVIVAPVVGSPMSEAAIFSDARSAHATAAFAGAAPAAERSAMAATLQARAPKDPYRCIVSLLVLVEPRYHA